MNVLFDCGHQGEILFACPDDEMDADQDQVVAALSPECPLCAGEVEPGEPNVYVVEGVPTTDIILRGSDHEA
ncbi:MAG: hypothetical protein LAN64_01920 [Acidobacteriia bacterium]|nr:hypothetical protein [Terriglobia bacterium]